MTSRKQQLKRTLIVALLAAPVAAAASDIVPDSLPFRVGENLGYRVRSTRFGQIGRASMRIDGAEDVRGRPAIQLSFDFSGRILLARVQDHTRSWIDPSGMMTYRYSKQESSPLASHHEAVEIFPAERRWLPAGGAEGESPTDEPLDELSFLYFIRTLPLDDGAVYAFDRHFDPARNPVHVRVIGRPVVTVPAGQFNTIEVEMRVKPVRRLGGSGVLTMYLTDDARRIPVRIETSMPLAGTMVLDLEQAEGTRQLQ